MNMKINIVLHYIQSPSFILGGGGVGGGVGLGVDRGGTLAGNP